MSETLPAAEIEAQAALWLERRHFGAWDDAAKTAFDMWLAESPAHLLAYWRLDATWNRTERLVALKPARTDVAAPQKKRVWPNLMRLAAVAAIVAAVAGASSFYFAKPRIDTYSTALGERKILTLPDGSKIELNTDSVLRLAQGGSRRAWLDKGEAYFQIKHNSASPFAVEAAGHRVTDLGTAFTVRTNKDRLEVSLLEGSARLDTADARVQQHSTVLIPGDLLVATSTTLSVTKRPERRLREALGWRRGVLVFDHTTLADAAEEFNRYNHTKLIVADGAAADRTIGATFPVHDVELFARTAEQVLGLRVEHRGGDIVISH
jgi:transmembrane sensor